MFLLGISEENLAKLCEHAQIPSDYRFVNICISHFILLASLSSRFLIVSITILYNNSIVCVHLPCSTAVKRTEHACAISADLMAVNYWETLFQKLKSESSSWKEKL